MPPLPALLSDLEWSAMTAKKAPTFPGQQVAIPFFVIFFSVVVVRSAWLNDDAYITFRTVDNFVNGHGLTWNPDERVQAYTHPLWMFLLAAIYSLTHEIFYTGQWLSIGISTLTVLFIASRLASSPAAAVLTLLIFIFSKAFIDYSTSGLENPLTHLLLAAFLFVYFKLHREELPRLFWLALLATLGLLNRLDSALFYLPPLFWIVWQARHQRPFIPLFIGFLPFFLWEIFSIIYYGFPLPNTAYAKAIHAGVPTSDLARQGLLYLQNSLKWDPITLLVIVIALLTTFWQFSQSSRDNRASNRLKSMAVALGILLHLLYIIKIGGDFMSGRFLTAPLLVAVILLLEVNLQLKKAGWVTAVILITILGLTSKDPALLNGSDFGSRHQDQDHIRDGDIADERLYYYPFTGLLNSQRQPHPWQAQGQEIHDQGPPVLEHGNIGFLGFYAGPQIHIVDRNGLADPLLARLPTHNLLEWRIGHFRRNVPAGYTEGFFTGENLIHQPELALYYDKLSTVIRGDLWTKARWLEIWKFNTGQYDAFLSNQ
jgi:arabinofuranosyltransferase